MSERLLFLISWLLWRIWFSRRGLPAHPRAILVIKLDHLGDGILASPAFACLRRAYPTARIDLVCARWNRSAFVTNPHINRTLEFNPRTFRRDGRPCDAFGRKWQALAALRGQYDLVVSLRGTWLSLILAHRCWIDRGATRVEMRLRRRPIPTHETDITLSILELSGIPTPVREPEYPVGAAAVTDVEDLIDRMHVPRDRSLVAFHVGSPVKAKRWLASRFAYLAERLAEDGAHVLLLGALAEAPLVEEVRSLTNVPMTDLAGKTTFPQMAALLTRCAAFVGNDSAPMHVAAAVGTPTVGLFFASDPDRFGPRGEHVHILRAKDPRVLSVDAVIEAVRRVWSARRDVPKPSED